MRYRLLAYVLFALPAFSGCQQADETDIPSTREIKIISSVETRSTMETGFRTNDEVGIFMLTRNNPSTPATLASGNTNWIHNADFRLDTDGRSWKTATPYYWKDAESVIDAVGYYPYRGIVTYADPTKVSLETSTDQQSEEMLRKNDFLYAKVNEITFTKNLNGIPMEFKHKLSKLTVNFDFKEGETPSESKFSVEAINVLINGTVDLNTGKVTTLSDIKGNVKMHYSSQEKKAEVILMPQTIPAGTFLSISYKGESSKEYNYVLKDKLTLESGTEHVIDLSYNFTTTTNP